MTNLEGRVILRQRAITPPSGVRSPTSTCSPALAARLDSPVPVRDRARRRSSPSSAARRRAARPTTPAITYDRIRDEKGVFWGGERLFADVLRPPRRPGPDVRRRAPRRRPSSRARTTRSTSRPGGCSRSTSPAPRPGGSARCPTTGRSSRCTRCSPGGSASRTATPVRVSTRRGDDDRPGAGGHRRSGPTRCSCPFHWVGRQPAHQRRARPGLADAGVQGRAPRRWSPHDRAAVVVVGGGMAAVRLAEQLAGATASPSPSSPTSRTPPYNRILLSAVLEGTHSGRRPDPALARSGSPSTASTCASVPACSRSTARPARSCSSTGNGIAFDRLVLA